MMAEAIIDIPTIPRINELGSVNTRRHSTGKMIMPNGGLTVFSRYLRASQGSCHDICKYGTSCTLETESNSARSSMPKIVTPKPAGAGRTLERTESNLGERKKKSEVSLKLSPDFKTQEPDDPDVIKIAKAQGGHHVENAEANLTDRKKSEISVKHSGYTKPQKPDYPVFSLKPSVDDLVDIKTKAAEGEVQDEENAETKFSKGEKKPKPSSLLRQACSSGKQNIKGSKSKERSLMSMTPVPSGKRTSVMGDKKNVVATSVSLFPKESSTSVSSMNAQKWKSRGVCRLKKQENAKQIKPEKSCGKNAKGSKNLKGLSHLMDQENLKKPNSEEASFADIPEKTLYVIESNPENKPAESIQNRACASDFSTKPSSSSKDKSMKHTRNRIPIGQSPRSYEKKNMIYRPKGIHTRELPPSLLSIPGKKSLRSTPYGFYVIQPSLASSSSLTSSKSPHGDALSQHDEVAAQKQKSSSKMMYKGRPKMALITTSKDKHLRGEKLIFQKGKMIEFSERKDESNPGNKPAESIQNSVHASDFSTMPSSSPKDNSMKHTRNRIPIGQSPRLYEKKNMIHKPKGIHARGLPPSLSSFPGKKGLRSIPYGLYVTQPSLASSSSLTLSKSPNGDALSQHDEVAAQKQKSSSKMVYEGRPKMTLITTSKDKLLQGEKLNFQRGKAIEVPLEDCTPRRLAFKPRVLIDNRNGDDSKEKVEDCTPKRLKFRRRVLVDNRNVDNKNRGEEFTPRRLKFRPRVLVNNRNADNQNDRGENCTPRKLKLWRRVLDDNKTGYIQNTQGDTRKNNSEGKEASVGQDNATEVKSDKIFLRHNDVEKKKDSGSLYNNMIEETTSRLVKTSKVKALVSAFETVISDLDSRISATNNIH